MSELEFLIDKFNQGEPIPVVEPKDLRAALALFSEVRDRLGQRGQEIPGHERSQLGFSLDDLAARCTPNAVTFAVALRGALLDVVLQLYRSRPDRVPAGPADFEEREFLIRAMARIPLLAAELTDTDAILRRIIVESVPEP